MGFSGLPSDELFGDISVKAPVAPRHTEVGHERCAYYKDFDEERNRMVYRCKHWAQPTGGLYSEDFVRELRILIESLDGRGGSVFDADYETIRKLQEMMK